MANASKKKIGAGAKGKHSGAGAMTDLPEELLQDNQILSNRDNQQRGKPDQGDERGQDGKWLQSEQRKDTESNQR